MTWLRVRLTPKRSAQFSRLQRLFPRLDNPEIVGKAFETLENASLLRLSFASSEWHYLCMERTDDEVAVLIACEDGDVHEGYFVGKIAYHQHAPDAPRLRMKGAYAWTDIPIAPPKQ